VAILVGLGTIAGVAASLWVTEFVSTLLYGLQPRDPVTLAAAVGILTAIGVLAGWLPAVDRSSYARTTISLQKPFSAMTSGGLGLHRVRP
jgi:hypothetical protein